MGKSMSIITTIPKNVWDMNDVGEQKQFTHDLESGKVLFFPKLCFELLPSEQAWLKTYVAETKAKNISFNPLSHGIRGFRSEPEVEILLQGLCSRFHEQAKSLVHQLFPFYKETLKIGMTSLRPVEIEGRVPKSPRKDDRLLHVDAFPSRPNQGKRILRVFSNINMQDKARVWRVGEPFSDVAKQFFPQIKKPIPGSARLLKILKITKSLRTSYDNAMLQIHDAMKMDAQYQSKVAFEEVAFPPGSTWIVFSDSVSHAVLSGQHMMEQTFYLPAKNMQTPELSPLKILEELAQRALV
jgi:hypothetical protein